jgi:hypothetical protein
MPMMTASTHNACMQSVFQGNLFIIVLGFINLWLQE